VGGRGHRGVEIAGGGRITFPERGASRLAAASGDQ